ncbi:glycosyltransferase [Streptococcus suis]|nr:glycosyltransferase [Streptococcus suis]HEM5503954.1 glycosyltransferase [Streptococcus suis]
MNKFQFDIIVPIYNIENELEACLESLRNQTYNNFTVLMIDDGSTDSSAIIAQKYANEDQRFNYFFKENGGLSDARNFGLDKANHDYILFIDGDDFIEASTLEFLNKKLDEYNLDVLEFNGWYFENGHKTALFNSHYIDSGIVKKGSVFFVDNLKAGCMYSAVWLKVVNRKWLQETGLIFEKGLLHEDELWTPQLYLNAERVMYIDTPLYNYVQRQGSIMHQVNRDKNVQDAREIYYKLENVYSNYNLTNKQRKVLMDYLARKMLGSFYEASQVEVGVKDINFVFKHAKRIRTFGQAAIYRCFPTALPIIKNAVKKIIRY